METDLSFFGITRFSLILSRTLGSFRSTRGKTVGEAKSVIWEPERLRKRLWFFRNFCLPTYRMMSGQSANSHGVIVFNEDLPILGDVIDLCRDVPRLNVLILNHDEDHRSKVKGLVKDVLGDGRRVFSYRYDDDDALSERFLPLASGHAAGQDDGSCISFNLGYSLSQVSPGQFGLKRRRYPMIGLGLGVLSNTSRLTIISEMGSHTKIKAPVCHDTTAIGWLSPLHDGNDSHVGPYVGQTLPLDAVKQMIAADFPMIDFDSLSDLPIRRQPDQR